MANTRMRLKALAAAAGLAAALALGHAAPAAAQAPSTNPTANAVSEDALLRELDRVQGRITIPDDKAAVLIQPDGRDWRQFRRETLPWVGGIAILGMLAVLALFLLVRGRVRLERGYSGRTIVRFSAFERFVHWMTATAFIVLAISGLNVSFGRQLLLPLVGHETFTALSQWLKYAHNYLGVPFALGILFMFVMWVVGNLPARGDMKWITSGGGMIGSGHPPPAARFNAGQKLIFWSVVIGGTTLVASGVFLLFPALTGIGGLQTAEQVHAIAGMVVAAIIIAHIYIGTIGMEGAFSAMGTGEVDLNWAREHHGRWVEEELGTGAATPARPMAGARRPVPAE